MNNKVVLTQEEATAIEWVKNQVQYKTKSVFVDEHVRLIDSDGSWLGEATCLSGMRTETLIVALYIGYEIKGSQPKEVIEIKGRVTVHPESETLFIRLDDGNERFPGGEFIESLGNTIAQASEGDSYFGDGDLNPGDKFTLKLEIERKRVD